MADASTGRDQCFSWKFYWSVDIPGLTEEQAESLVACCPELAAPFRSVRFIPTGGVTTANLAGYLANRAVVAVGGTWMVAPDLLAARQWGEVRDRIRAAFALAAESR